MFTKPLSLLTLLIATSVIAGVDPSNQLKLGDGAASNKTIQFNKGSGAANPRIRWNNATSKIQFSNDGTVFADFGSGSGGGSAGFNALANPEFETGVNDWTNSGGTFAAVSAGSNLLFGSGSATFDASATSQYFEQVVTVPVGLGGRSCLARILYLGGDANLRLQALDASNVELGSSQTLSAATTVTPIGVPFLCPASGATMKLRVSSTANAAIAAFDRAHLGEDDSLFKLSQANFYGGVKWPATTACSHSRTTGGSTSYAAYSADADCTLPTGANVYGRASDMTGQAKIPSIYLPNLPAGEFQVFALGNFRQNNGSNHVCSFVLTDGTTVGGTITVGQSAGDAIGGPIAGRFGYSTSGTRTFSIQSAAGSGTPICLVENSSVNYDLVFYVYQFPTQTEQAVRADTVNWRVNANISGANPSLGTPAVTSYTGITNAGLTLTNNSGAISAQIPCNSTEESTGTTCVSNNESVGVSFVAPKSGAVRACVSFTHSVGASGNVGTTYQIVQTPNAAQTISAEGGARIAAAHTTASSVVWPVMLCGEFTLTAGKNTLRLFYEQVAQTNAPAILADADANNGQRDIHWTVEPIDQQVPAPVLVGNISTSSSGVARTEFLKVSVTNTTTGSLVYEHGEWVGTPTFASTQATIPINLGVFSVAPVCTCTAEADTIGVCNIVSTTTTSQVVVGLVRASTEGARTGTIALTCSGAH